MKYHAIFWFENLTLLELRFRTFKQSELSHLFISLSDILIYSFYSNWLCTHIKRYHYAFKLKQTQRHQELT